MYSEITAWGQLWQSNVCRDGGIRPIWELLSLPLFIRVKKKIFPSQPDINVGRNRNCLEGPKTDFLFRCGNRVK